MLAPVMTAVQEPIPRVPDLRDSALHGAWLNKLGGQRGIGKDFGPDGYDLTNVSDVIAERVGGQFDGSSNYLRRAVANWQSADNVGTVTAWFKLDALGSFQSILASSDEATNNLVFVVGVINTNRIFVRGRTTVGDIDEVRGSTTLVTDVWYHLVIVSTGSEYILYLDGELETPDVVNGTNSGRWLTDISGRDNVVIGSLVVSVVTWRFGGEIREVCYYDRALTASEAKAICLGGVPDLTLVGHWFDSGVDKSRFVMDLAPQADAIVGHDITLDGTGDYLYKSVADWRSGDSAGTVMAWVKRAAINAFHCILCSADEASLNYSLNVHVGDTPRSNAIAVQVVENGTTLAWIRGGTTLSAGRWYHVAVVSNGSSYVLYVDGVAETPTIEGGSNNGSWFDDVTLRDNVTVGCRVQSSNSIYFNGSIRDVRVYSEAKAASFLKEYEKRTRVYF